MRNLALVLVCVACLCTSGSAYFITVDAHAEECFFDKVETGTKLGKYKYNHIYNCGIELPHRLPCRFNI